MGINDFIDNAVVGDGEDTDVECALGFANEALNTVEAIFARAEVGGGLDAGFL